MLGIHANSTSKKMDGWHLVITMPFFSCISEKDRHNENYSFFNTYPILCQKKLKIQWFTEVFLNAILEQTTVCEFLNCYMCVNTCESDVVNNLFLQ